MKQLWGFFENAWIWDQMRFWSALSIPSMRGVKEYLSFVVDFTQSSTFVSSVSFYLSFLFT
jgi:hypothetical protein